MAGSDFNETVNAALKNQDWPLVTILGEAALAEGKASDALRYNLGLAYLKTDKPSMATAVLISVPEVRRDEAFQSLLKESLRLSSASMDDLNTGAHGLTSSLCQWSASLRPYDPLAWSVSGLALCLVLLFVHFATQNRRLSQHKNHKMRAHMRSVWIGVVGLTVSVTVMALVASGLSYFYQSRWGVVVAENGAALQGLPAEQAAVVKNLKPGKPVLVVGNPSTAWVRVIESDGGSGWMAALDVRVVRE